MSSKCSANTGRRWATGRSPAFWRLLVQSDPEKALVARATASFICRVVLAEVLGSRLAGMRLEFSEDPVRLSDVFGAIERALAVRAAGN